MNEAFFWLKTGQTWLDKLRLLLCWLSPRYAALLGIVAHDAPGEPIPIKTIYRNGKPFYLRKYTTDARIMRSIFCKNTYYLAPDIIGQVKTVIDLGANIGMSSLYFADIYPTANIIAVEPDESTFNCLRRNTADLEINGRITPLNACVNAKGGTVNFSNAGPSFGRRIVDSPIDTKKVKAFTLSEIIGLYKIDWVDILKIDIEGAEKDIFEAAEDWISKVRWILVEIHFDALSLEYFIDIISHFNRHAYARVSGATERWDLIENPASVETPSNQNGIDLIIPPENQYLFEGHQSRPCSRFPLRKKSSS